MPSRKSASQPKAPPLPATLQMALARTMQRVGQAHQDASLTQAAGQATALGWTPKRHRDEARAILKDLSATAARSPLEAETALAQAATHEQLASLQEALKIKPLRA